MLKEKIENKQSRLRLAVIALAFVMTVTGCSDSSNTFYGDKKLNETWVGSYNGENLNLYLYNGGFELSFGNGSIMSGEYETYLIYYYYYEPLDSYWGGLEYVSDQELIYQETTIRFETTLAKGTIHKTLYEFFRNGWSGEKQYIVNGNTLTIYSNRYTDDYWDFDNNSYRYYPNGRENDDGREVFLTFTKQ